MLNTWIQDPDLVQLHLAYLSAIPKSDRPTTEPKNLRPISVSSIWYRWVAKFLCYVYNLTYLPFTQPTNMGFVNNATLIPLYGQLIVQWNLNYQGKMDLRTLTSGIYFILLENGVVLKFEKI